jgi:hypothetical protein
MFGQFDRLTHFLLLRAIDRIFTLLLQFQFIGKVISDCKQEQQVQHQRRKERN